MNFVNAYVQYKLAFVANLNVLFICQFYNHNKASRKVLKPMTNFKFNMNFNMYFQKHIKMISNTIQHTYLLQRHTQQQLKYCKPINSVC